MTCFEGNQQWLFPFIAWVQHHLLLHDACCASFIETDTQLVSQRVSYMEVQVHDGVVYCFTTCCVSRETHYSYEISGNDITAASWTLIINSMVHVYMWTL
jgi:hypothetical protein